MNLQTRVRKLEGRVKLFNKHVYLIFQHMGESEKEVTTRIRVEKYDLDDIVIVVKFVENIS